MNGISIDMLFASLPKHEVLPLTPITKNNTPSLRDSQFDKFLLDDALLIGLGQVKC
jgi:hypothetical protein